MQTISEMLNKSEVVPPGTASDIHFNPTGAAPAGNKLDCSISLLTIQN